MAADSEQCYLSSSGAIHSNPASYHAVIVRPPFLLNRS